MPASSDGGPETVVPPRCVPAPVETRAVEEPDVDVGAVPLTAVELDDDVELCGGGELPEESVTTNAATRRTKARRTTARRRRIWVWR